MVVLLSCAWLWVVGTQGGAGAQHDAARPALGHLW